ncbi:MAG: putative membrane protein [Glaciecola sp.]|jgi:uncharacterized membrane protein
MNDAHLHLVVNHFPIIGSIFGLGTLVAGIVLKNNTVKNTAYCLFVVSAIFAAFSMATGEGAEEMVEDMPNIGKQIIHEHEEIAENLALILYLLAVVSIGGIFLNIKNHAKAKVISYVALVIGIGAVYVATLVGTSGGNIRHTEIREDSATFSSDDDNVRPANVIIEKDEK